MTRTRYLPTAACLALLAAAAAGCGQDVYIDKDARQRLENGEDVDVEKHTAHLVDSGICTELQDRWMESDNPPMDVNVFPVPIGGFGSGGTSKPDSEAECVILSERPPSEVEDESGIEFGLGYRTDFEDEYVPYD